MHWQPTSVRNSWNAEVAGTNDLMSEAFDGGADLCTASSANELGALAAVGFRARFIKYNAAVFETLHQLNFATTPILPMVMSFISAAATKTGLTP